jgi:hypothetical protein
MRLAACRWRFPVMAPMILAIVTGALVSVTALLAVSAPPASAEAAGITVSVDRSLTLVNQPVTLTIAGQVSQSLNGAQLVVLVKGPVDMGAVGQTGVDAPLVTQITNVLGSAPVAADATASTTATTTPPGMSTSAELAAGLLKATMTLPSGTPPAPGAYLLAVEVQSGGTVLASGQTWTGKAAVRETALDASFVLPVSLGIHRDPDGAFFDRVLEAAVAPTETGSESMRGLLALSERFPDWNLTLAVEPFLLTQLRDMADGYVRVDSTGSRAEVGEDDLTAQNAGELLSELRDLAADDSLGIAVSPYTGADLGILAAEGWRDGLEQIQMGKQELQRTLELEDQLIGAYSPDLSLTSESLAYYADASIDYVVVGSDLAVFLAEEVDAGTISVRTRNSENDRITLVFANSGLSDVMAEPWNVDVFGAALAAELAATTRNAIVIAPEAQSGLVPESYLESIGELLNETDWIRTQTLQGLVGVYPSGTRPVLFNTASDEPQGYIENSLLASVRAAHTAVADLATAADVARTPVDTAHRLLYMAESSWWSRPDASPQQASMGLAYAAEAQAAAQGELHKVRFLGADSSLITGQNGTVELTVENAAEYPMIVELQLIGTGVALPDGDRREIELQPGRTELVVKVTAAEGPQELDALLLAGTSVLDEISHSVRFIGLMTVLPWLIVVAGLLVGGAAYLVTRRYLRRRRAEKVD